MDKEQLLKTAKKRFTNAQEQWNHFNRNARTVLEFINGEQWDHQLRTNREAAGLPVLTVNVLPVFLRQITNEARQNCPAIQIDPRSDNADSDTAETYADLIRGIEQESNASTAYDVASWYAAASGVGYFRVVSEYEDGDSFFQRLVVKGIDDPETVLFDPQHRQQDGSDAEYVFIISIMSKDEYSRTYADSKLAKDVAATGWSSNYDQWVREDEVMIAEYYYKEYKSATLYQVFNTVTQQTIVSTDSPLKELVDDGTLQILNERPTQTCSVKWCKLNDVEVLEETTWPGQYIPVIAVKGEESWISGKRKLKGAVEDAIDSQRALNYFQSLAAELVQLSPKAPYVGVVEQFAGFEHLWRDANVAPAAFLPYNNVVTASGQSLGAPVRQQIGTDISAVQSMVQTAHDNIKAVFGIFDASVGNSGNEHSGVAILARTAQSHTTTYHFYDNLVKAVQQCGRIMVETIPTFYADERTVQLIKRSGESSAGHINDGKTDVTRGSYGVVVETGPSYATRRQDSVSHMLSLGQAYPAAMPLIADLIAGESDWPGAKQIAARLRLALPPEIQQAEAADGKGDPAAIAQMAQSQVKQLTAHVQELQNLVNLGHQELTNSKEELKLLKDKSQVEIMKVQSDQEIAHKQLVLDELEAALSYKIKQRQLDLQEQSMKLSEAKLALESVSLSADIAGDMHDHAMKHDVHVGKLDTKIDKPTGLDKSFQSLSGEDVGNA